MKPLLDALAADVLPRLHRVPLRSPAGPAHQEASTDPPDQALDLPGAIGLATIRAALGVRGRLLPVRFLPAFFGKIPRLLQVAQGRLGVTPGGAPP